MLSDQETTSELKRKLNALSVKRSIATAIAGFSLGSLCVQITTGILSGNFPVDVMFSSAVLALYLALYVRLTSQKFHDLNRKYYTSIYMGTVVEEALKSMVEPE